MANIVDWNDFNPMINGMAIDSNNDIYTISYLYKEIMTPPYFEYRDFSLDKYDNNGNYNSGVTIPYSEYWTQITIDINDNIYLVGTMDTSPDNADIILIKNLRYKEISEEPDDKEEEEEIISGYNLLFLKRFWIWIIYF